MRAGGINSYPPFIHRGTSSPEPPYSLSRGDPGAPLRSRGSLARAFVPPNPVLALSRGPRRPAPFARLHSLGSFADAGLRPPIPLAGTPAPPPFAGSLDGSFADAGLRPPNRSLAGTPAPRSVREAHSRGSFADVGLHPPNPRISLPPSQNYGETGCSPATSRRRMIVPFRMIGVLAAAIAIAGARDRAEADAH